MMAICLSGKVQVMTMDTSQVLERPAVRWVMNVAQTVAIAFICWLGQGVASSVTSFSDKLDGVVKSIAEIAAKQVMQQRDAEVLEQRVSKLEGKNETLEQKVARIVFVLEQQEKERPHGR